MTYSVQKNDQEIYIGKSPEVLVCLKDTLLTSMCMIRMEQVSFIYLTPPFNSIEKKCVAVKFNNGDSVKFDFENEEEAFQFMKKIFDYYWSWDDEEEDECSCENEETNEEK